jgi:DNA-binding SARP family transcriptional activator
MSFSLKLFGGVALTDAQGHLTGPVVQRHRLALLALLAASRPRPVSRDRLIAYLWPERDIEPARRLLDQAVQALREVLGADALRTSGEDLLLDTGRLQCDVVAFEDALAAGAADRAAALYAGAFLDGFFLDDTLEFERWVERERARFGKAYARVVETLAEAAERAGDPGEAADWWRARAAHDPFDSRVARRLMQALEDTGNRAGALQHSVWHQQLLREELEIEAAPGVAALADRLRRSPWPGTPERAEVIVRAAASPRATAPKLSRSGATGIMGRLRQRIGL